MTSSNWPATRIAAAAIMVVAGTDHTWAQVVAIEEAPYCDCRVAFEHVTTLGAMDGPGALPGEVRQVQRSPAGTYYVTTWREPILHRFSADGRALQPFGRMGQGPGEFGSISQIVFSADSLVVFDRAQLRLSVFDVGLRLVRTARLAGRFEEAELLPDGRYIVNGVVRDDSGAVFPLHYMGADGVYEQSFGDPAPGLGRDPTFWIRALAVGEGGAWSAHVNEYRLRRWDDRGVQTLELVRTAPWLTPFGDGSWGPDKPIPPRVVDITVDPGGNIRALVLRASPRWKELLPPSVPGALPPVPPGVGLLETVVEIIDPRNGRLVAQGVFDTELYGFVDAETLFSYHEDGLGVPTVGIWKTFLEPNE